MTHVFCLLQQQDDQAMARLPAEVTVTAWPIADLLSRGWEQPLILLGGALSDPGVSRLLLATYGNPSPLLILPPLPLGDVTSLLNAPAPVKIVRQRASDLQLTDEALKETVGHGILRVYCTEVIETALHTGILATANGKPAVWAYRPTRVATPVIWVAPQLLLASARTDPVDCEALFLALLAWAEARIRPDVTKVEAKSADSEVEPDPGVLRALVVAWAVRPDLTGQALSGWLRERLFVETAADSLVLALKALQGEGVLDSQNHPQVKRISDLVDEWGLQAWVREAHRMEDAREG
jgi:hypothetical protein